MDAQWVADMQFALAGAQWALPGTVVLYRDGQTWKRFSVGAILAGNLVRR